MNSEHSQQNQVTAFEAALAAHIHPLLPGSFPAGRYPDATGRSTAVTYDTQHRLRIYAGHDLETYFVFERKLPFCEEERCFIEKIIRRLPNIEGRGHSMAPETLVADSVERAVAGHAGPELAETVTRVITIYEKWAEQGRDRVAHTTGIRLMRQNKTRNTFFDLAETGFLKTLGSNPDTLVVIDGKGGSLAIERMARASIDGKRARELFAPVMFADIAAWANSRRTLAVRLTERGTILLFNRGKLLFAKRSGQWQCLPHTLIDLEPLPESVTGIEPETIKAVYHTALDLAALEPAAGKAKARIGLVRGCPEKPVNAALGRSDGRRAFSGGLRPTPGLLYGMTGNKRFCEIPRIIRAELCSLGEPLLLDGKGNFLSEDSALHQHSAATLSGCEPANPGRLFPAWAYMDLFNMDSRSNLNLDIY